MKPVTGARLTCISDYPVATYSGMLPGVLAGQYPRERMEIDLVRLCASAGARLLWGKVERIDCVARRVYLEGRPSVPFDLLSIGIGSRPRGAEQFGDSPLIVPIKPMQSFYERLEERLKQWFSAHPGVESVQLLVVGAGVGGVEITFCLPAAVRHWLGDIKLELTLMDAETTVAPGTASRTRRRIVRELQRRGVQLVTGCRAVAVEGDCLVTSDGRRWPAAAVVWATGAEPAPLLANIDARRDDRGFLLVRSTLQTVDHDHVFAVGDCATLVEHPVPKAGVYAVRQGPYLWENLQRAIRGEPLLEYRPQRNFLKLINLGDGRAIGEYHGIAFQGRVWWRVKDWIDSRFIDKYQDYRPMMVVEPPSVKQHSDGTERQPPMRCLGCGGKVSASVLSRVLHRLEIPRHPQVLLGLEQPDDAAIVRIPEGSHASVTLDFFTPPLDDAYLAGRIAALHAASDCFAMGGRPFAALAGITLPYGSAKRQEELLYEILAGAVRELRQMGATLVGGHTIEGPRLMVGFTLLANQPANHHFSKNQVRPGDRLLLTKPLGSGVLLAGHMRAMCRYRWYEKLLEWMLKSNQPEAEFAAEGRASAITDVTGFGLVGHLMPMLEAARVGAELFLDRLPVLEGARQLIEEGIESTLAPENRGWEPKLLADPTMRQLPEYKLLFDPQTCGGLLMAVPPQHVDAWEEYWKERFGEGNWWIGQIVGPELAGQVRLIRDSSP